MTYTPTDIKVDFKSLGFISEFMPIGDYYTDIQEVLYINGEQRIACNYKGKLEGQVWSIWIDNSCIEIYPQSKKDIETLIRLFTQP